MKSKCKPIVLSKKDKIKTIVFGLIICYLLVLFFICTLIRDYCKNQLDLLWDEVKRFENPHSYYVDLSEKLWGIKQKLLEQAMM